MHTITWKQAETLLDTEDHAQLLRNYYRAEFGNPAADPYDYIIIQPANGFPDRDICGACLHTPDDCQCPDEGLPF